MCFSLIWDPAIWVVSLLSGLKRLSGSSGEAYDQLSHSQSPATRTLVTAKDRILKPHIVKYNGIALKRRLVKFLEKRPIFIVGMKTYVKRSISFDWHIRYQLRAVEFCKNIFIVHLASNVMLFQKNSAVELKFKKRNYQLVSVGLEPDPLFGLGSGKYQTPKRQTW